METNNLAATAPEQTTAAPEVSESAPEQTTEEAVKPVETPKTETEPEWFTKRFGEITAKYRETERERDYLRQQLQLREQQEQQRKPEAEKPKTLADFDYDEAKFQSYVVEQAREAAKEAAREAANERREQETRASRARKFQEREIAFERETKDYREVAHYAPISNDVAQIIQDMEAGPEVAYFLGKNRDIALSINDLPPHIAAIELGRIDARLSMERKAKADALEKARAEKAVSKAPEPTSKIDGSGSHEKISSASPDSDKLSDEEWVRAERARLKRKAKA